MRDDAIARIASWAAERTADEVHARANGRAYDSPIERIFATAFHVVAQHSSPGLHTLIAKDFDPKLWPGIFLLPQHPLLAYRVDFVVRVPYVDGGYSPRLLVIECDGHDFHERTREQAQKDRLRDRAVQAAGHVIFRFTGSEIWRDPIGCAQTAMAWVSDEFFREAQ